MKQDLLDMNIDEMKEFAAELGEKPYRGKQLFQWIYRGGGAPSIDEMSNLPASFRDKLKDESVIGSVLVEETQTDRNDGTVKFLFQLKNGIEDAEHVEGVLMRYRYGNTLCLSSQIGCRMSCAFCASALGGYVRDLSAGEMVGQLLAAEEHIGERIDHIVVMGMGEPFDNYGNLSRFLRIIHEPEGRKMSYRNMTVSTCGLIPGIVAFAEDFPQVNLAISLHRTEDVDRSSLMPVNRKYPLKDLLAAADAYTKKTRRRITFEYALQDGVNDRREDAEALIKLLRGMLCHVNLIPLNRVDEIGMAGSSRERAEEFSQWLNESGIPATVRRRLGADIDGACGQLRIKREMGRPGDELI